MKIPIKKLVESVAEKIAFPKISLKILKLFENEETLSAYTLAKAISVDPALAAYIIKVANSAFYNLLKRVKTLSDAIALLGFEEVKKIVIMVSMKNVFSQSDFMDEVLWEHALCTAVGSSMLNDKLKFTEEGSGYIMGLLHDIGKIVFKRYYGDEYAKMLKNVYEEGGSMKILEEQHYGYNHADVGAYLLDMWNFDREVIDAVSFHHVTFSETGGDFLKNAALVNLADSIANFVGVGRRDPEEDLSLINKLPSAQFLHLELEDPVEFANDVYSRFVTLKETLE